MVTVGWLNLFPNAQLTNLLVPISDHSPILLSLDASTMVCISRGFCFENCWLEELGVDDGVTSKWNDVINEVILSKLQCCSKELESWSKKIHGNYRKEVEKCKDLIEDYRLGDDPVSAAYFISQRD